MSGELVFLPLGGAGEIGMNLNLYGFGPPGERRWLMVDLGVTFGDAAQPGADVIMPDPAFIAERRERLEGLVLTHAHEDHLGAVPYLWERLQCPVYATPFTRSVLKRKLDEVEVSPEIIEVPMSGRFTIGPFDLELITLTHSIPEPNAIAIRTALGTVLHTGDWKLDPGPVVGPVADEDALRRVGSEGVLAMVCDSTNVFVPGASGSESGLLASLTGIIGGCEGRVAVTCFSSNVARLETIAAAAAANDRNTGLAGRSLRRFDAAARENGYLASTPAFLAEDEVGFLPRDKAVIICTGSQGDPRAALKRIADGGHAHVTLEEGDTVIFSARVIPGNEAAIARLQNRLTALGVRIVTERDHLVHVSGHPARDELVEMYQLVRPRIAVPVHGELRHMVEHANLARDCQVPEAVVAENGAMVRLGPGRAAIVERVPSGRLAADGKRLIKVDGEAMRGRRRALFNGVLVVTVVLDSDGMLAAPPRLTALGLLEEGEMAEPVIAAVEEAVRSSGKKAPLDDDAVAEEVRIAARRVFREIYGKKPVTSVHLVRV